MANKKKRVNPRKRPISIADAKRLTQKATDESIHLAIAIFLMVLKDKFLFDNDQIVLAWQEMDKLSEEVKEGRVNVRDFIGVLSEEYNIDLLK